MKNQYKEALAKARAENKLVFINFTGYACTNCHWMKANMFPRPEIAGLLKDFVLVDLYTDGTDAASEQNQQLEEKRFGTVAIPFYAIVDPDEHTIATFPGLTRNASEFVTFLEEPRRISQCSRPGALRQIQLRRQRFLFPVAGRLPFLQRLLLQSLQQLGISARLDNALALLLQLASPLDAPGFRWSRILFARMHAIGVQAL